MAIIASMTRRLLISVFVVLTLFVCASSVEAQNTTWAVQSVDTMKTSRDQTLYKMSDPSYDSHIQKEVEEVKNLGATHITVDGAYDPQYIGWIKRWVAQARKEKLRVWYRGNFSGWHGWFGPKNMTREEHMSATREFITKNPDLFEDGDIFTACPECEYGGPGNPLETGDIAGFRMFMIDEVGMMKKSFAEIEKNVNVTSTSLNPDVAKKVIDAETLRQLDNTITLDYFFKDISVLQQGLDYFRQKHPGVKFVIGEFGAPIPEINGSMTPNEKSIFIDSVFRYLYMQNDVIGVNYWVTTGGATELFDAKLNPTNSADTVKKYFDPRIISGVVRNQYNRPISDVTVSLIGMEKFTATDQNGAYHLPVINNGASLMFTGREYKTVQTNSTNLTTKYTIQNMKLQRNVPSSLLDRIIGWLKRLF